LHHVGDLFELNVKLRCQSVNKSQFSTPNTILSVSGAHAAYSSLGTGVLSCSKAAAAWS